LSRIEAQRLRLRPTGRNDTAVFQPGQRPLQKLKLYLAVLSLSWHEDDIRVIFEWCLHDLASRYQTQ
jgi:hypothetical protein